MQELPAEETPCLLMFYQKYTFLCLVLTTKPENALQGSKSEVCWTVGQEEKMDKGKAFGNKHFIIRQSQLTL